MIWILPALSLSSLAAYWLWNAKLRRDCDAQLARAVELLDAAKYRLAMDAYEDAFTKASRILMGQGDRAVLCALGSAEAMQRAGQSAGAYDASMAAFMLSDRQAQASYSLRLYTLMADLSEENGHAQRGIGMRQVAIALLRRSAAAHSPELTVQLGKLGVALANSGLPEHAVKALSEAVTIYGTPAAPELLMQLGSAQAKLGRNEDAKESLEKALGIYRSEANSVGIAPVLSELGSLHCNASRYEEAIKCFEEAYRLQVRISGPSDAQVGVILTAYANCLRQAGKLDTAEDTAARAVKLLEMNGHPALANGLGTLGAVLLAEGNYTRAVEAFEQADEAASHHFNSPLETAERLESHATALDALHRALDAEQLRSGASSIRSTLASVPPAEEMFAAKLEDFLESAEWRGR